MIAMGAKPYSETLSSVEHHLEVDVGRVMNEQVLSCLASSRTDCVGRFLEEECRSTEISLQPSLLLLAAYL